MSTIQHANIADADRHEPKGASTATSGSVYVSNGAGSGSWTVPTNYTTASTTITANNGVFGNSFVVSPKAGTIVAIHAVIEVAGIANSLTFSISGTNITGGSGTFSSAALGTAMTLTPTANNTVAAGTVIKCVTSAGSGSQVITYQVVING